MSKSLGNGIDPLEVIEQYGADALRMMLIIGSTAGNDMRYSDETIALVALLHDVCKINVYKKGTRNKKIDGEWHQVDVFEFEDNIPFGHGEKSVYMIQPFMRITREEAFAIRYHMGFSGSDPVNNVGKAFELFPLAFALSTADMEATYFLDKQV